MDHSKSGFRIPTVYNSTKCLFYCFSSQTKSDSEKSPSLKSRSGPCDETSPNVLSKTATTDIKTNPHVPSKFGPGIKPSPNVQSKTGSGGKSRPDQARANKRSRSLSEFEKDFSSPKS